MTNLMDPELVRADRFTGSDGFDEIVRPQPSPTTLSVTLIDDCIVAHGPAGNRSRSRYVALAAAIVIAIAFIPLVRGGTSGASMTCTATVGDRITVDSITVLNGGATPADLDALRLGQAVSAGGVVPIRGGAQVIVLARNPARQALHVLIAADNSGGTGTNAWLDDASLPC